MHSPRMIRPWAQATAVAALLLASSCVTRGYPTHGGGKRFFQEQALVAGSIDAALAQIDFQKLADMIAPAPGSNVKTIGVHMFSVGHSGGGVQTGSGGFLGQLFGVVPVIAAGQQVSYNGRPIGVPAGAGGGSGYMSYGFETADDMRYLMGRLISRLGEVGLRVQTADGQGAETPTLCVLVRQLGIDQSDFNAIVYSEKLLRARTNVEAFLVSQEQQEGSSRKVTTTTPLGAGVGTMRFREDFFLGFGPISGGVPEVDMTEDGR